jgi:hypothetical protein
VGTAPERTSSITAGKVGCIVTTGSAKGEGDVMAVRKEGVTHRDSDTTG